MKANQVSGITREKNSTQAVVGTEIKTESKKSARKSAPKTNKKSTVKPIEKIVEKADEKVVSMSTEPVKELSEVKKEETHQAVKASEKKTVKKQTKTGRKPSEKKTIIRKKTEIKKEFYFQYYGQQIDENSLVEKVVADCKEQGVTVKDMKLYLKPEDNACYYVVNGNVAGKVDLY